jgi:hypothetical protein
MAAYFYVNGRLFSTRDISLNGNLNIGGNLSVSQFSSNKTITTTNYQLIVSEDLSLNGRLFVSSDASFGGNLWVGGKTTLNGLVQTTIFSTSTSIAPASNAMYGSLIECTGAITFTQQIPSASNVCATIKIWNNSTVSQNITNLGGYFIGSYTGSGTATSLTLNPSEIITLTSDNYNWIVMNDGNVYGQVYASKIGVGTNNPQAALDVSGAIRVSGGITPTYTTPSFSAGQVGYITTGTAVTNTILNNTPTMVRNMIIAQPGIYLIESMSLIETMSSDRSMSISITFPNGGGSMAANALAVYFGNTGHNNDWPLTGIATITGSNTQVNLVLFQNTGVTRNVIRITFQATRIA